MTLAGIITVAVSLCVLGGALLLSRLVDHGTQQWKNGVELEIFMKSKAPTVQTQAVQAQLKGDQDVRSFKYLPSRTPTTSSSATRDQPDLVNTITPADLPASFRVAPRQGGAHEADRRPQYQNLPGVDQVKTASKEVKELLSASTLDPARLPRRSSWRCSFASLFLIVNTIRLATFARRREIEVMKLVGASNWFVRIPFMLEGMVQGVVGRDRGRRRGLRAPAGPHRRDPGEHRLLEGLVRQRPATPSRSA